MHLIQYFTNFSFYLSESISSESKSFVIFRSEKPRSWRIIPAFSDRMISSPNLKAFPTYPQRHVRPVKVMSETWTLFGGLPATPTWVQGQHRVVGKATSWTTSSLHLTAIFSLKLSKNCSFQKIVPSCHDIHREFLQSPSPTSQVGIFGLSPTLAKTGRFLCALKSVRSRPGATPCTSYEEPISMGKLVIEWW